MSISYYFGLKDVDDLISKIRGLTGELVSEGILYKFMLELSHIHICKFSGGWKPLFESSHYFTNMIELEAYYNKNKDNLIIKDEYDIEITWEEFKNKLNNYCDLNSHVSYANHKGWNNEGEYYIDSLGYEWYRGEFD